MDLVAEKQRSLCENAQLPPSDVRFLQDTRLFDFDDHDLHRCSLQRVANYLTEDVPFSSLLLSSGGAGQLVLDARVFAALEEPSLRFGDIIGPRPTVAITVSIT
jgi:hypothetical protein